METKNWLVSQFQFLSCDFVLELLNPVFILFILLFILFFNLFLNCFILFVNEFSLKLKSGINNNENVKKNAITTSSAFQNFIKLKNHPCFLNRNMYMYFYVLFS